MQTLDFATLIGAIVTLCGAIAYLYRRQETEHDTRREELKEAHRQVNILTGKLDESEDERARLSRRLAEATKHYKDDDE